jgi:hypothetical protein
LVFAFGQRCRISPSESIHTVLRMAPSNFLRKTFSFSADAKLKSSALIFAVSCYGGALFILNAIGTAGRHGA